MAFIYSTLANSQLYTEWTKGGGDMQIKGRQVLVSGGAGVMGLDRRLITPLGVSTEVDDELIPVLRQNPDFKMHEAKGFIKVIEKKSKKAPEVETIVPDMAQDDKSKPLTPAHYAGKETVDGNIDLGRIGE